MKKIKVGEVIEPSRGAPKGVHVELGEGGFGPPRSGAAEVGAFGKGAYVEFDAPNDIIPTNVGPRKTGVISTGSPFPLRGLSPKIVKIPWWKFWIR